MKKGMFVFHPGEAFESEGSGRFAKEILRVGKWIHPATKRDVIFKDERVTNLSKNAMRWLANGNTIPFPNGHTTDALSNLGIWPGPFIKFGSKLVGVVEPKAPEALSGIKAGTIDGVSAYIEKNVTDPKGVTYDEVITHVCATNYPVVTESQDFIALSKDAGDQGVDLWIPEALAQGGADCDDPMDLHAAHAALKDKLDEASDSFKAAHAKYGPDHEKTQKAAGTLRDATTRMANHAALMHRHVENMTSAYPYRQTQLDQDKKLSLDEALSQLAERKPDQAALDQALEELAKPKTL